MLAKARAGATSAVVRDSAEASRRALEFWGPFVDAMVSIFSVNVTNRKTQRTTFGHNWLNKSVIGAAGSTLDEWFVTKHAGGVTLATQSGDGWMTLGQITRQIRYILPIRIIHQANPGARAS
jgi:hypothetical protein